MFIFLVKCRKGDFRVLFDYMSKHSGPEFQFCDFLYIPPLLYSFVIQQLN